MFRRLSVTAAILGICAVTAATALAAGSPSVTKVVAGSIKDSSAVLQGEINPNGYQTGYYFQWGLTAAYGASSAARSAGHGVKPVAVSTTASGLLPGTVYHYRLFASNVAGQTIGVDHTFKTKGNPPPNVATGAATAVGRYNATLTGVVNPNNEATSYEFQYGLTAAYGSNTFMGTVPAGGAPVNVASTVAGLESGSVFHFRIVAFHGGSVLQYGADSTFLTEPWPRYKPTVKASTTPRRAGRKPFVLTTAGHLSGPGSTSAALACTGVVNVRFFNGRHRVSLGSTAVQPDCGFSVITTFRRLPRHPAGTRTVRLKVLVRFAGNGYLAPRRASTEFVTLGSG